MSIKSATKRQRNRRLILLLGGAVIVMFAFGYALVPLYDTLCNVLGINGKTNNSAISYDAAQTSIDKSRLVTVEFISNIPTETLWEFYPLTKKVRIHPGEIKQLAFFARNQTDHTSTVQAVPSVTPAIASKYLKKTECFCFTQQTLEGQGSMEMPLLFHLDPELPAYINTVTLSYTLYDVTDRKIKPSKSTNRIT